MKWRKPGHKESLLKKSCINNILSSTFYDYCILGAGLAGLSLADALLEQGQTVCVVEKYDIASGASGTPLGMVNPATGRRATKTWRAEKCYDAISANLEKVTPFSDRTFYERNGVLRPALTAKIARKMREQYEKTDWPEGWCRWLPEGEIKSRHPGITCVDGGLWIPVGITVDVSGYLEALAAYLHSGQVQLFTRKAYSLEQKSDAWDIQMKDGSFSAGNIVFATGHAITRHPWWKELSFHSIKGQIAIFKPEQPLSFVHSVSSLGYIAHLDREEYAQGSTYEHDFDSLEPDKYGENYLRKRLKRTLPDLEQNSRLVRQWAGVRVSTPNRKPVLGRHKNIENVYLFAGLGSKGLMYGKYLGQHLAEYLVSGKPLTKEVSIGRFDLG